MGALANAVREKYPDAYKDIDDTTLEAAVVEKYPVYAKYVEPIFDVPDDFVSATMQKLGKLKDAGYAGVIQGRQALKVMDVFSGRNPDQAAAEIAELEQSKPVIAKPFERFEKAKGFDAFKGLIKDLAEISAQGVGASVPSLALGAGGAKVGAAVGGPYAPITGTLGLAAGIGLGSAMVESGSTVLEVLAEEGVDIRNKDALAAAFKNPAVMQKAKNKALTRGVVIGTFDAASAGLAGRFLAGAKTTLRKVGGGVAEFTTQSGLGAGGEAAAAVAIGEKPEAKAVAAEAAGEIIPSAIEAALGIRIRRPRPTVTPSAVAPVAPAPVSAAPEVAPAPVPAKSEPIAVKPTPVPVTPKVEPPIAAPTVPAVAPTIAPAEGKAAVPAVEPAKAEVAPTAKPEVAKLTGAEGVTFNPVNLTDKEIGLHFDNLATKPVSFDLVRDPYVLAGYYEVIDAQTQEMKGRRLVAPPDEITGERRVTGRQESVAAQEFSKRMTDALTKLSRGEKVTQNDLALLEKYKSNAIHEAERFSLERTKPEELRGIVPKTEFREKVEKGGTPVSLFDPADMEQKKAANLKRGQSVDVVIGDAVHTAVVTEKSKAAVKLQDDVEVTLKPSDNVTYVKGSIKEVPETMTGKVSAMLDSIEKQAKENIGKGGPLLGSTRFLGVLPSIIIIGMVKIARGTVKFAQWSAEMVRDYGPGIRPRLREIYTKAQTLWNEGHTDAETIRRRAAELAPTKAQVKIRELRTQLQEIRRSASKLVKSFGQEMKSELQFAALAAKGAVQSVIQQQTQARRELVDIVLKLPRKIRGNYLKAIANAKDEKSIRSVMDRLERDIEQHRAETTARQTLEATIKEKDLQRVENLQTALKLPPIASMTVDQMQTLNGILAQYKTGDEFLPVRQLETIDQTTLKGLRTVREVQEHLASQYGLTPAQLPGIKPHPWMYDTQLARQHPLYDLLVDRYNESYLKASARIIELTDEVDALIQTARASRPRDIPGRLVSTDAKIVAWLESNNRAKVAEDMTEAELKAAQKMDEIFKEYYDWLARRETEKKFGSRFEDKYFPHVRRGFLEAWKESGFLNAVKEAFDQFKQTEKLLTILDQKTGAILPYQKWVGFAQFRTGGLVPTRNAAKAFEAYVTALEKARQFDEFIPEIMVYVHSLTPKGLTARGVELDDSLVQFVKTWINSKKGRVASQIVKPGSKTDWALRMGVALTRMRDLGLNVPVGIANVFGEQAGNVTMLGPVAYAKGLARLATSKGRAIAEKYPNFVGRSIWTELNRSANTAGDKLLGGIFALFAESARRSNQVFLLASMTPGEYVSGEISTARLAQLRKEMGKYRVVEGAESIFGKSAEAAVGGQYKKWAIPILVSTVDNARTLAKNIRKDGLKALRTPEAAELFYSVGLGLALGVGMIGYYRELEKDKDRDFIDDIIYKSARDTLSMLGALDPKFWGSFAAPRLSQLILDLSDAAHSILLWEKSKKTGELKGVKKLVKTVTPAGAKPFVEGEKNERRQ